LLALGPLVGGERIDPAVVIPIIDMLFEGDYFCAGDGLLIFESGEQGIGRRTTGAALGGEELDDYGTARRLVVGGGGVLGSWRNGERYRGERSDSQECERRVFQGRLSLLVMIRL
jgi:hypothetical protein